MRTYRCMAEQVAYFVGAFDASINAERGASRTASTKYPNAYNAGYWDHYQGGEQCSCA